MLRCSARSIGPHHGPHGAAGAPGGILKSRNEGNDSMQIDGDALGDVIKRLRRAEGRSAA